MFLENPTQHLLDLLESNRPRWIIGLVGMPGAGKSTLATRLAEQVNAQTQPDTIVALGMDGFHLSKAELRRVPDPELAFARRGAPWTFDVEGLATRIQALRNAAGREAVTWPDFQHDIGDPVEAAHNVPPETRLVLIEGLYLLHHADGWETISASLDERWYLDTPLNLAMERLAQRHMAAWNFTRAEADARIATNDRPNAELVLQSRVFADWIVVSQ